MDEYKINNLRYLDVTVFIIVESEAIFQKLLEVMTISKKIRPPPCSPQNNGKQIKLVSKFKCLDYLMTPDGKGTSERPK